MSGDGGRWVRPVGVFLKSVSEIIPLQAMTLGNLDKAINQ